MEKTYAQDRLKLHNAVHNFSEKEYLSPFREEVFSAIKGQGSFLNGQPIGVSKAEKLSNTIVGLGTAKRELADENFARFRRVFDQCQDVRRIGSAALELAYTACGRQGGYFEGR